MTADTDDTRQAKLDARRAKRDAETDARITAYVAELRKTWPPLTDEQKETIARIFRGSEARRRAESMSTPTDTNQPGDQRALGYPCPDCLARPGRACTVPTDTGRRVVTWFHNARIDLAQGWT